jgi:hypothetical protein
MWWLIDSPVGVSNVPAVMEIRSSPVGFQNRLPPHATQYPRSARSDDANQRRVSSRSYRIAEAGAEVIAAKWPDVFRHCRQWHATTGRNGPVTV